MALTAFTGCKSRTGDQSYNKDIPQMEYNYLTGMPFENEEDKTARPIAVMINNAKIALPQSGLANADIIYEAVTEGGVTRLMALYSDIDVISRVGPVRSARDRFIEMMLPLNAIYVHIGTSTSAKRMLNFYSYQDIDGIYLGTRAFLYDSEMAKTKSSEHCWFTNKDLITEGINANSINTKNSFYPAFDFVDYKESPRTLSGKRANSISFVYSDYADVSFNYDETSGKYLKNAFGAPHMDADTGTQLAFDNVFVVLADIGVQEENGVLADIDLSEGEGYYFSGGKYEKVLWKKGSPENPLIMYDTHGDVLKTNTGKTYVGILGTDRESTLTISREPLTAASVERVQ